MRITKRSILFKKKVDTGERKRQVDFDLLSIVHSLMRENVVITGLFDSVPSEALKDWDGYFAASAAEVHL